MRAPASGCTIGQERGGWDLVMLEDEALVCTEMAKGRVQDELHSRAVLNSLLTIHGDLAVLHLCLNLGAGVLALRSPQLLHLHLQNGQG